MVLSERLQRFPVASLSRTDSNEHRTRQVLPVFLACLVAAWAAWTCPPAITGLDAGDFAAAGVELGVPHATGFGLYTLLLNVFGYLPSGTFALKGALLSGVIAAYACGLFLRWGFVELEARALSRESETHNSSWSPMLLGGALLLAWTQLDTLAFHARVIEAYALSMLLVAAIVLALARLTRAPSTTSMASFATLVGLGLSHHALFRLWCPLFVLGACVALWRQREGLQLRSLALGAAQGGALGLSFFLVPLACARAAPRHNWGNPDNLERWWTHINAGRIQGTFSDRMFAFDQTEIHLGLLGEQVPVYLLAGLLCLALGLALRGKRWEGSALFASGLADLAYSVWINPMGLVDYQNGQLFILSGVCAGWYLGISLTTYLRRGSSRLEPAEGDEDGKGLGPEAGPTPPRGASRKLLLAAPVMSLPLLLSALTGPGAFGELRDDWGVEDVVFLGLVAIDDNGTSVSLSDSYSAVQLYLNAALYVRPDLVVVNQMQLTDPEQVHGLIRSYGERVFPRDELETLPQDLESFGPSFIPAFLRFSSERAPVHWEVSGSGDEISRGFFVQPDWPTGRALEEAEQDVSAPPTSAPVHLQQGEFLDPDAPLSSWARSGREDAGNDGLLVRRWEASQWGYHARRAYLQGDFSRALSLFLRAAHLNPEKALWWVSSTRCLAQLGAVQEADAALADLEQRFPYSSIVRRAREQMDAALQR